MAQPPPDISAILAALGNNKPGGTPQAGQAAPPPPGQSPFPAQYGYPMSATPPNPAHLQQQIRPPVPPSSSTPGAIDLSAIKPVSTGSVSLQEAIRVAHEKAGKDPRTASRGYRRSRSRSRSPARRDSFRNNEYNPYRDERRDPRARANGRDRSFSPSRRGNYSPPARYDNQIRSPGGRQDDSGTEVIQVASSDVGLIIGRGGENLRRVEAETGARVQFLSGPENSGTNRSCRISGSARQRADAKQDIFRTTQENPGSGGGSRGGGRQQQQQQQQQQASASDGDRNSLQIMVPDKTVGLIIGRGGETIRDLQDRSGCHVNITAENHSVNGMRPVNLIGSREAQNRAQELILEVVSSDTRSDVSQIQIPGRNPVGRGYDQPPQNQSYGGGNSNEKINDTMHVPSEAVGMIIGKGGETIKDMQNQSGCKINVSQPSGADITREIGLIGSRSALDHAKTLINEKVNAVREKQGGRMRADAHNQDSYNQYNDYSRQQQQGQPSYGQGAPNAQGMAAQGATGQATDPYAMYGGYENYMAMWAMAAQQQQQQQQQTPGGQGGAPPS